jgi:hypothetical protein
MVTEQTYRETFGFGNDPVVFRQIVGAIAGGKVLDTEGYEGDFIQAGQVVTRKDGAYKPLPVKDGAYEALPDGYEYAGFVTATVSVKSPFVGIVYSGEINDEALPVPLTAELKAAIKTAIPTLVFDHDEDID